MTQLKIICILLYIAAYHAQADKYTDENRPYEFGFTIEGEQHRHEKKDENGIIMGEFGFITADGVYHVTVYATDENGNFKIISMKNIRVKPYPTAPTQNLRQGHSLALSSPPETKTPVQTYNRPQQISQDKNSGPAKTCSHCSVPTTTTPPPKLPSEGSRNKINQYNTQIQLNKNSLNHEHNSQQNTQQNYFPQNVENSYNQKSFTANGQSATGQSQYMINKQPSREINTPLTSTYPQSPSVGQNNLQTSGRGQTDSQQYPQSNENDPRIPDTDKQQQQHQHQQQHQQQGQQQQQQHRQQEQPPQQHRQQQQQQSTPPLRSNTGIYSQTQGQSEIAEAGKTYENNALNSNKYTPNTYNEDKNLPNVPSNNININRQPKSFNEILESVNLENGYNIDTQSGGSPQSGISNIAKKPVLVAAQMQIVDKNTDIYHKNPGEKDGLPQGLTRDDMKQLLYTFNYTLGFHGHHEKGYTDGAKIGYYFVTGRNGIRMRVDYVADETGFHPKISQEVLDTLSDDVPKPETEKDDKFGLKGYEFKWLYYPVNSP